MSPWGSGRDPLTGAREQGATQRRPVRRTNAWRAVGLLARGVSAPNRAGAGGIVVAHGRGDRKSDGSRR
jgi:hypothetical protein